MKIKKAQLDTLIEMNRAYWQMDTRDEDLLLAKCKAKRVYADEAFGDDLGMIIQDIVSGVLKYRGLKPDATNEDIHKMFEALGYEVTE